VHGALWSLKSTRNEWGNYRHVYEAKQPIATDATIRKMEQGETMKRRTPSTEKVESWRELLRWAEAHPRSDIAKLLNPIKRKILLIGPERVIAMCDGLERRDRKGSKK
jgi:hypothetical protein